MKNAFFQLFALVTLAGLMLQGCQKEPQSVDSAGQSAEMAYTPKAAKLVADINSFKQKMTAVRENPHLKSGEVISKEEARWNIETLFNVTYGFPDLSYSKTVTDTALVYLPVDASGNALLEDVVAVYEEVLALVTDFYLAANFDEKGFLFMQLKSGETNNGLLEIKLEAVTGARLGTLDDPPVNHGPFFKGDDWMYGFGLGNCEPSDIILDSDAAKQIQYKTMENRMAWPIPPDGFRWMTANSFDIELKGNEYTNSNGDYLIFYIENYTEEDMCLDSTKMNFHYYGEQEVIYNIVPDVHPLFPDYQSTEEWVLFECVIEGKDDFRGNSARIRHHNIITYAERYLVPVSEIALPNELTNN